MKNQKQECEVCGADIKVGTAVIMEMKGMIQKEKHICKNCFSNWNKWNNEIMETLETARNTADFRAIEKIYRTITY